MSNLEESNPSAEPIPDETSAHGRVFAQMKATVARIVGDATWFAEFNLLGMDALQVMLIMMMMMVMCLVGAYGIKIMGPFYFISVY